jgi:aminoglycoside phosphotransferase (APT) family kinase protein
LPTSGAPAIVHGDYRLTNMIYAPDLNRIAAVVDWEMATIGDPLTDVGLMLVYHALAADSDLIMPRLRPSDGFLSTSELAERYAAASGRELAELAWYVSFGYFKLAVIAEGIHHRYLQGQTVGEGFDQFGTAVPRILSAGLDAFAGTS